MNRPGVTPRNRFVSWVLLAISVAILLGARSLAPVGAASLILLGSTGLGVSFAVRRALSWARVAYVVWAVAGLSMFVAREVRVEPEAWKVAAAACLVGGPLALLGLRIRTQPDEE